MPSVLRVSGFRFFFFSNEGNEPPHIHVNMRRVMQSFGWHGYAWLIPKDSGVVSGLAFDG